jgi:hypothetical protein
LPHLDSMILGQLALPTSRFLWWPRCQVKDPGQLTSPRGCSHHSGEGPGTSIAAPCPPVLSFGGHGGGHGGGRHTNYKRAWLSCRRGAFYFGVAIKRAQRTRRPFRPILNH